MQLDLNCPVELVGYDLTHDEHGVRGFVRLFNLSDKPVVGFDAVITWQSESAAVDIPLSAGVLHAMPHEPFILPIETDPAPVGRWSGLFFVRVDFEGAPPWRGNPKRFLDVELPEKPSPVELEALQRVAGPDAAFRPLDAKSYWICVCGRANPGRSPGCDRCGRGGRDCMRLARQVAEAFQSAKPTEDAKKDAGNAKPSKPLADEEQAFHEALQKRYLRQKNLLIRRTVTMLTAAALIGLIALAWTWLIGMQQRAKDIVPPTRIEDTAAPSQEDAHSATSPSLT